jgi:hypothetical protein
MVGKVGSIQGVERNRDGRKKTIGRRSEEKIVYHRYGKGKTS